MESILIDTTKFKLAKNQDVYAISRTIERRVRDYLRVHVKNPGHISEELYNSLYPNGSHIGVMYGLPKVHKAGNPVRPICSAVGTSTYKLGKYVAEIIQPAAVNCHGTDLKDTFQFVSQLKDQCDLQNCALVSFDVQSLFTNVPLADTIDVCMDRLYRGDSLLHPALPENVLRKLLSLCVCENTFVFNGKVYSQVDGVAMGSSLGPVLANIWMTHLEEKYIHGSSFSPDYYRRYVDDTFCIFRTPEHVTKFHEFLNSLHPSTKFDMEVEEDGELAFLDTIVTRNISTGLPDVSTKVKATDKGLFYDFNSFLPEKYKSNLVCSLVYRVYMIASSYHIFDSNLQRLCHKLSKNGFPKAFVEQCVAKVLDNFYAPRDDSVTVDKDKDKVLIVLPYLGPMSIVMKRNVYKLVIKFYPSVEFKVIFKRGFRISNMFNFKDKLDLKSQSGVVYYINCNKCGPSAAYIGKTKNTLHERFYGSNGHLNPKTKKSALHDHMMFTNDSECGFDFDKIKILDASSVDYRLRIIESVYLKYDKQSLNTQEYSYPLKLV